jgi:hypothetical protein
MAKYTGRGAKFSIEGGTPGTYTEVAQVQSIGSIDITADETEVTTLDNTSGFREFLQTFKDAGEMPLTLVWDPELPSHGPAAGGLWDLFIQGTVSNMKIEWATVPPYAATFSGFVKSYPTPQATPDDALMAEVSIRVAGTVTLAEAGALAATEATPAKAA